MGEINVFFTIGQRKWGNHRSRLRSLLTSRPSSLARFYVTFFGHGLDVTFSGQWFLTRLCTFGPPDLHSQPFWCASPA